MARRGRNGGPARLRNVDYTDRELLHVIDSVLGSDGTCFAADIADALGIEDPTGARSPAGTVAVRMSWMKRYGFVDRISAKEYGAPRVSDPPKWIITPVGRALMGGRLTKAVAEAIRRGDPGTELLIMRQLVTRAYVEAPIEIATAVRREYLHGIARRPR